MCILCLINVSKYIVRFLLYKLNGIIWNIKIFLIKKNYYKLFLENVEK